MKEEKMKTTKNMLGAIALSVLIVPMTAAFAEDAEALAKKLANPIAAMISVPFQYNYDSDIGPFDRGSKSYVNVQPVIPFSMNDDWNLITRTIVPVIWQDGPGYDPNTGIRPPVVADFDGKSGIGSTSMSLWASPKEPTDSGWIWGVGPIFLLPTATDSQLGGDQWGTGPTGVALKQMGPWTVGGLANHIWSFAQDDDQQISSTFIQPFLTYTTPAAVTYALNTESTYNWEAEEWAVPINFMVSKVMKFGTQLVSLQGGVRYWAVKDSLRSPEGWGARATVTFIFPK